MKKIICMLLLIQGGFLMAQTETLVTPNGKKVQVNAVPTTADNGLTMTGGKIQLSGALIKPTVLTTTATNTLTIGGLQTGASTDNVLVADANGVLKWVTRAQFGGDNLGNHIATTNLDMSSKDINNIWNARIKYELVIYDRIAANTNTFNFYKNNGSFSLWNGSKSSDALTVNETTNNAAFASTISFPNADASKILFLGYNTDAARIEHSAGYNLGMVSGAKITPNSGLFTWSNYSGVGGIQNELMRLNAIGNLGIGSNNPVSKLHIAGDMTLNKDLKVGGTATTAGNSGTDGQVLISKGSGAAPSWVDASTISIPAPTSGAGTMTGKNLITISNGANNAFKNTDISLTAGTDKQVLQTVGTTPTWVNASAIVPTAGSGTMTGRNLITISNGVNNAFANTDISLTAGTDKQVLQTVGTTPTWVNASAIVPTTGAGTMTGKNLITISNGANNAFANTDISLTAGTDKQVLQTIGTTPTWVDASVMQVEPWQVQGTTNKATSNADNIYQTGKVGIGTNNMLGTADANVKLAVNGSILTPISYYADYVFEDYLDGYSTINSDYSFKSLHDVEKYINENKHLPGVTSIKDLKRNEKGEYIFNITDLSIQSLEKIEELYLHTIEQQKQLDENAKIMKAMSDRIDNLEKLIGAAK